LILRFKRASYNDVLLGLNIKFERKGLMVLGYTRRVQSAQSDGHGRPAWEYSDKAVELFRRLKAQFPEVFACLSATEKAVRTRKITTTKKQYIEFYEIVFVFHFRTRTRSQISFQDRFVQLSLALLSSC
jgi:hypothetical protein